MELFKLGDDYVVELNKEWISTIKEFKNIITRDKGSNGDHDGRFKQRAKAEFTYIFHAYDFKSPYTEYEDKERFEQAANNSGLKLSEIQKDTQLQEAIKKYLELQQTRSLKLVKAGYKAMEVLTKTLNSVGEDLDGNDVSVDLAEALNIQKAIKELPSCIKTLRELDLQVKAELSDKGMLRGGVEKGIEEDPEED